MNGNFFFRALVNMMVITSLHPRALARDSLRLPQNIPSRQISPPNLHAKSSPAKSPGKSPANRPENLN
jgi:hypothetical protein